MPLLMIDCAAALFAARLRHYDFFFATIFDALPLRRRFRHYFFFDAIDDVSSFAADAFSFFHYFRYAMLRHAIAMLPHYFIISFDAFR